MDVSAVGPQEYPGTPGLGPLHGREDWRAQALAGIKTRQVVPYISEDELVTHTVCPTSADIASSQPHVRHEGFPK